MRRRYSSMAGLTMSTAAILARRISRARQGGDRDLIVRQSVRREGAQITRGYPGRCRMSREPLAMKPRAVVLLFVPPLLLGCAPVRVGSGPADAPVVERPAPAASPAPSPAAGTPAAATGRVDFETQVRPLLQEKCSPCHFAGGQMHDKLPFDSEATIRILGPALFTRLKDPVDVELLRVFLGEPE